MTTKEIISKLEVQANPKNVAGMARFGISGKKMLGVSIPVLRKLAKDITKSKVDRHTLAQELWDSKIHEVRILASMVDEPQKVTSHQMDTWISDFDSWDICDQVCMNLFCLTDLAPKKIGEWVKKKAEFERRAGFALLATWAWKRKDIDEKEIVKFLPLIIEYSTDDRNYVRKAVNWALRQIGKRSDFLMKEATKTADKIIKIDDKTARWVAGDALREFAKIKRSS